MKKVQCFEDYEMPRRLNWDVFRKIYDIQPKNYEELITIPGFGPAAVRALSLIGEIIFGTKISWRDPVKYNFAHGEMGYHIQLLVRLMINPYVIFLLR